MECTRKQDQDLRTNWEKQSRIWANGKTGANTDYGKQQTKNTRTRGRSAGENTGPHNLRRLSSRKKRAYQYGFIGVERKKKKIEDLKIRITISNFQKSLWCRSSI